MLHTSQWSPATDLTGKRVGVIGTGATAVQLVPELAKVAAKVIVFQRTPVWCSPRNDVPTTADMEEAIRSRPQYLEKICKEQNDEIDDFNKSLQDEEVNRKLQALLGEVIRTTVNDTKTAAALTPKYPVGCKRLCVVDDYWPAFNRPNVELVADPAGVTLVTAGGPKMSDGTQYNVDALVMATGYDAFSGAFKALDIRGSLGVKLADRWRDGPSSLCGVHVRGFPNMFLMVGPLGPGIIANVTATIRVQAQHVAAMIAEAQSRKLRGTTQVRAVLVQASEPVRRRNPSVHRGSTASAPPFRPRSYMMSVLLLSH